jgi:hypothetical protein
MSLPLSQGDRAGAMCRVLAMAALSALLLGCPSPVPPRAPPLGVLVTVTGTVTVANSCDGALPAQVHVVANLLSATGAAIAAGSGDFALVPRGPVSVATFSIGIRVIGAPTGWEIASVTRTPSHDPICECPDVMKCPPNQKCQDLGTKTRGATPLTDPIDYTISCKCST